MDRITALLNRRLAGIPAWVWGVIIGGSIALYAYLNREEGPNVAAETVPYVDEYAPGDAGDISGIPTVIDNEGIPLESNPAWTRYVVDRMRIAGEDPTLVHNAITKVLAGLTISQAEAGMWNLIVSRYGPPPEGAPPIDATPAPSPGGGEPGERLPPPRNIRVKVTRRFSTRSVGKKVNLVVRWDKVDGAGRYDVRKVFPGTSNIKTAHTNRIKFGRQDAGPIYRFQVRAIASGGGKGQWGEGQVNT